MNFEYTRTKEHLIPLCPPASCEGGFFHACIIQKIIYLAAVEIGAGLNLTDWVRINIMGPVK